jgi:ribosomal protein S18 acetylase RimI-like enzyme
LVDRVTIVAAGEQWKDGWPGPERARFAIEDWLGAGAIAGEVRGAGAVTLSAEADVAARAFAACRPDVVPVLLESVSGRELTANGFGPDVTLAAAVGVDDGVPWLRTDGFVERLPFAVRPAGEGDRAFLAALKHATMRDYVVAAFGAWDERDQHANFGPDLARIAVVAVDGRDVAMLEARVTDDGLYLANIQVTPAMQSRGLGGRLVELLASTAHARGRPLVLRVLKVNHRAQQFYERMGLTVTGELQHHWSMKLDVPAVGSS